MDKQDIFDRAAEHLITQNEEALDENGNCVFLAKNGNRCAVGALIPENHAGLLEKGDLDNLLNSFPDLLELFGEENISLLYDLQYLHDVDYPEDWPDYLRGISDTYDLDASIVYKTLEKQKETELPLELVCI